MSTPLTILGIAGSLRQASYNRGALRAAIALAPAGVTIRELSIGDLPLYNQDLETDPPAVVRALREAVRAADAVLIATPEYNYSVPGVLKNALDWGSRPAADNAWRGKPAAIMGATGGLLGTARAQYHLRQMFVFLDMYPLNRPEVMIARAREKFDAAGNLTDAETRERIKALIEALVVWTRRLRGEPPELPSI
jgi:chromate reductase